MGASVPLAAARREADLRAAYMAQVSTFPDGHKIDNCLQCGSCTGSCPVSHAMDVTPRQIVALFRAGYLEEVLRSRALWMCASCYACTIRCPAGIRVTDNLYALKRVAKKMGIFPRKFPVHALADAFIQNIRRYGRNWELWLGIRYYLTVRPAQVASPRMQRLAWRLMRRNRLGIRPTRIRGIREVRAIIERAHAIGGL